MDDYRQNMMFATLPVDDDWAVAFDTVNTLRPALLSVYHSTLGVCSCKN